MAPSAQGLKGICAHYLAHRFDLLGSGWIRVHHGMHCCGVEGHRYVMGAKLDVDPEGRWLEGRINGSNLRESKRIWRLIFDQAGDWELRCYAPIDWQLDSKSGYRWSEKCWYMSIPFGHEPGVDVKVPWELARMQHLPQLAALTGSLAPEDAERDPYVREFRAQLLDFIATNPPRFGVNWHCTMDVAIRLANWLVAYDLFRANGVVFDQSFDLVFRRSAYEHGCHIAANLEVLNAKRGNHYLANIVGLLFAAVYLPGPKESDAWLVFSVRELFREVRSQFAPDGTNFENSTCYHRLSAEMVIYATALILGLPPERRAVLYADAYRAISACPALEAIEKAHDEQLPLGSIELFPRWYLDRLEKMGEFVMHATKPNGRVVQVGDNDSGRFMKLAVPYQPIRVEEATERSANLQTCQAVGVLDDDETRWQEDHLDHRHLVAALGALFDRPDFAAFGPGGDTEAAVLRGYSGSAIFSPYGDANTSQGAKAVRVGMAHDWNSALAHAATADMTKTVEIRIPGGLGTEMALFGYPAFGLYVYRTGRVYLAVKCGPAVLEGNGAHAHNDQLSIELNVDGVDWIADPGSYLYTALPHRRNEYRSVKAHFAPRLENGNEGASLSRDLFWLDSHPRARCIYFGSEGFFGVHFGFGQPIYRLIKLDGAAISVVDWTEGPIPLERSGPTFINMPIGAAVPFSPGYGIQLAH